MTFDCGRLAKKYRLCYCKFTGSTLRFLTQKDGDVVARSFLDQSGVKDEEDQNLILVDLEKIVSKQQRHEQDEEDEDSDVFPTD